MIQRLLVPPTFRKNNTKPPDQPQVTLEVDSLFVELTHPARLFYKGDQVLFVNPCHDAYLNWGQIANVNEFPQVVNDY